MAHVRSLHRFMIILLICLLSALAAGPVHAGQPAQTVPTAGPSPTPRPVEDPGERATDPVPTAVLATSPVQGVQPSATPTATQTHTPLASLATLPAGTATSTAAAQTGIPQNTPVILETAVQPTQAQATMTALPTLAQAAPTGTVNPGGALCFPAGVLVLGVFLWLVMKFIRRTLVRTAG